MKRYFLCHDLDLPGDDVELGTYHFIALDGHGPAGAEWNVVCLADTHAQPPTTWLAFPPLIDATTTLAASAIPEARLKDIGLTGAETTLEALAVLGEIHPLMGL